MLRKLSGATLAAATVAALCAAPAQAAAETGYVRLAHLSPDTPAVDVYLADTAGKIEEQRFNGVAYGAMSDYLRLPTGTYSVAMRKSGAASATKPVLTTQVTVAEGSAYTVAGVGRYADLGLRVLRDDLKLPAGGDSKIRIIQASVRAPVLDVAGANGRTIADGVAFATTTSYRQVDPGRWTVRVMPTGGGSASDLPCTLGEGNVYSLLVLDGKDGGLKPELHIDAAGTGSVPRGGVATGLGGTAPRDPLPMAVLLAGLAALLAAAVTAALVRGHRGR
ncbi:DUF4397 domain-containing protein [Actinoplanes sp. N902-109]|uniref:DUF4397 domain-containing protein n=1 Tax=Actinoplanes sp. (strain N902-109) TaxID=649831 RepID=UPI00032944FD|nr:DUF4397 domain-containing protein [Actinoplanes sp. N902-109]AGL20280.1 LPXTG-motif cell wall anchor domain-containing protein [Actinoplanes sp. N902-109]